MVSTADPAGVAEVFSEPIAAIRAIYSSETMGKMKDTALRELRGQLQVVVGAVRVMEDEVAREQDARWRESSLSHDERIARANAHFQKVMIARAEALRQNALKPAADREDFAVIQQRFPV